MERFQHKEDVFWEEKRYSGGFRGPKGEIQGHPVIVFRNFLTDEEVYTIPVDMISPMAPPMTQHYIIEKAKSIDDAFRLLLDAEQKLRDQLTRKIVTANGNLPEI